MTTPRDDIAGLIERLRKRSEPSEYSTGDVLGEEAATQLDSLLKERDALQARVKELESGIAHAQYRSDNCDAENQSLYNRLEAVESRALRAEQERDSLKVDCSAYASRNTNLINDLVLAGLARDAAEQERDEAYERLINIDRIVHVPTSGKEAAVHHFQRDFDAIRALTRPYRRLAGPEKEKKE